MVVNGRDQMVVSSTVQNKKDFLVGVEGVFFGMGENDGGRKLANRRGEPLHCRPVQFKRVIAEVHALETGSQNGSRLLAFGPANGFDLFFRLARFLPEFTGFTAFPVGEGDHLGGSAALGDRGDRTGRPPDEVGRMGADD